MDQSAMTTGVSTTAIVALLALATLLVMFSPQAGAAAGVQLADGTSRVEADPNAPDPVVEFESDQLPFTKTAASSSSFAQQQTTFTDSSSGIVLDSVSHLSGSDLDFAYTEMTRRFTVTAPSLDVGITGLVDDSHSGSNSDLQTVVFRVAGGSEIFEFNDADDDDFSEQGTLGPGTYELEVRGECGAGAGDSCSADLEAHLVLGDAPPETEITSGPPRSTGSSDASFTYTSSVAGSTFECKLDAGPFESCPAAGKIYTGLAEGAHTFSVRATDPEGSTDPTPATRGWTVDPSLCPDVQVGFAAAQGCFTETEPGSGIFTTDTKAWVGGFEIVPRSGGQLKLDTNSTGPLDSALSSAGAGADVIFAGFAVPIPLEDIPVGIQDATFEIGQAGTLAGVFGIPVEGLVKVSWTDCAAGGRGCTSATWEQEVKLKTLTLGIGELVTGTKKGEKVGESQGKLKAKLENGTGFILQQAEISIKEIKVIPSKLKFPRTLRLVNLLLRFERKDGKPFWTGAAGIGMPLSRGDLTVTSATGKAFIFDGSLAGGGLEVDGINKQVLGSLFLQKVGGDLLFAPEFGFDLRIGATVGPRVQQKQLVSLDGTVQGGALLSGCANTAARPDPVKLEAKATLAPLEGLVKANLADVKITERACIYPGTGATAAAIEGVLEGEVTFLSGFGDKLFGYKGTQTGFISSEGASYEGSVLLRLPGLPDPEGSAIVSTVGLAACTDFFAELGFGHNWREPGIPALFSGCDMGAFRVQQASAAADRERRASLALPAGLPHAGFAATGTSGPPLVRVSGPGGFTVQSPADGSALRSKTALIVPVDDEDTTYVFVDDPRAGKWTVESLEADNPLAEVSLARGLDEPKIRGKVRKPARKAKSKKFRFDYSLRPIAGQKVIFTERGEGIARELGKANGRKGKIAFRPTIAADRRRTIEAEVIQDGLPRELVTVARFTAPALAKIAKPKVKAKRAKRSLRLSWPKVRGASDYLTEVKAGKRVLHRVLSPKTALRFTGTPKKGKLKVTVQAISEAQPPGPVAKVTVAKARKRT